MDVFLLKYNTFAVELPRHSNNRDTLDSLGKAEFVIGVNASPYSRIPQAIRRRVISKELYKSILPLLTSSSSPCHRICHRMSGQMPPLQRAIRRLVALPASVNCRSFQTFATGTSIRPRPNPSQSLRRRPLSPQCPQTRQFSSSSPRLKAGDKMYHRTGVRILIRGTSLSSLTNCGSHSH